MNDTTPQKDMAGEKGLDEIFDLEALAGATLHDEPYQYLVVPEFIRPEVGLAVILLFDPGPDAGPVWCVQELGPLFF